VGRSAEARRTVELGVATEAVDANEQLLLEHPGLHNFWDGKKWVVSHERFQMAADAAGVTLPTPPAIETRDMFEVAHSYAAERLTECKAQGVSIVPDETPMVSFDLEGMLGDNLLQGLGIDIDNFRSSLDRSHSQSIGDTCTDNGCTFRIVRIDTPKDLTIDRDLAGETLKMQVLSTVRDASETVSDKVGQRIIASSLEWIGIEQPRFLDTRGIHAPIPAVRFSNLDFSKFPLQEIQDADPEQKKVWVFEDIQQGFAVVQDGAQRYVISENPTMALEARLARVDKEALTGDDPGIFHQRLERFLGAVSRNESAAIVLARAMDSDEAAMSPESRQYAIGASQLLRHPGTVFIKSSRSAGGELVLRCTKDASGAAVIESDSSEVGDILAQYTRKVSKAASQDSASDFLGKLFAEKAIQSVSRQGSVEAFLSTALGCMETPIVEEEIPVTRLKTKLGIEKAEFRMIIQDNNLVAHYAKSSLKDIAANISRGGQGRSSQQVVRGIFQQKLAGRMPQAEINEKAGKSLQKLESSAQTFAREFAKKLTESGSSRNTRDFAVDLCPVWDEKTQDLKFVLLEVQYVYGFSGLEQVSPAKAAQVRAFKDAEAKRIRRGVAVKFFGDRVKALLSQRPPNENGRD
jgi:hypothetical protein